MGDEYLGDWDALNQWLPKDFNRVYTTTITTTTRYYYLCGTPPATTTSTDECEHDQDLGLRPRSQATTKAPEISDLQSADRTLLAMVEVAASITFEVKHH